MWNDWEFLPTPLIWFMGHWKRAQKNQAVYPARGDPLKRTRVASEELLQSWSHILKFLCSPGRNVLEAIWCYCCIPAKIPAACAISFDALKSPSFWRLDHYSELFTAVHLLHAELHADFMQPSRVSSQGADSRRLHLITWSYSAVRPFMSNFSNCHL